MAFTQRGSALGRAVRDGDSLPRAVNFWHAWLSSLPLDIGKVLRAGPPSVERPKGMAVPSIFPLPLLPVEAIPARGRARLRARMHNMYVQWCNVCVWLC